MDEFETLRVDFQDTAKVKQLFRDKRVNWSRAYPAGNGYQSEFTFEITDQFSKAKRLLGEAQIDFEE